MGPFFAFFPRHIKLFSGGPKSGVSGGGPKVYVETFYVNFSVPQVVPEIQNEESKVRKLSGKESGISPLF